MRKIKIQCPAKINLTLKILNKRPDGFHNIDSIMQTISLFDYLIINVEESESLQINLSGSSNEISYDESNLVYKAAGLFFETVKNTGYKTDIYIEKNIPIAAGLAGGSTDAAGTIFGLNEILNRPLSKQELHKICSALGSDLNVCLEGGTLKTSGRGEVIEPQKFVERRVSLIKPVNLGISAKEAYTKFSLKKSDSDRDLFVNDLEWAIIDDYSELKKIKSLYPNSVMSGSGSTYYMINGEFSPIKDFWIKNNLKTIPYGVKEV